jgi:hypothetical protein
VSAERQPEADQPEIVLISERRRATRAAPPRPQPRARASRRPPSSALAKCSCATDASACDQRSPRS